MFGHGAFAEKAFGEGAYGEGPFGGRSRQVDILLQTVLELGPKVPEGRIVEAIALPWLQMADEISKDPAFLHHFAEYPRKFEEFLAGIYEREGYTVVLTPRSADGGRDVIATREGFGSVRILDQAKAYSPGNLVTHDELRAMIGVLSVDQNASKGAVTTTSSFQPNVSKEFKDFIPHRLELRDGDAVRKWLKKIRADN